MRIILIGQDYEVRFNCIGGPGICCNKQVPLQTVVFGEIDCNRSLESELGC